MGNRLSLKQLNGNFTTCSAFPKLLKKKKKNADLLNRLSEECGKELDNWKLYFAELATYW